MLQDTNKQFSLVRLLNSKTSFFLVMIMVPSMINQELVDVHICKHIHSLALDVLNLFQ